jgi:hypothetical protein
MFLTVVQHKIIIMIIIIIIISFSQTHCFRNDLYLSWSEKGGKVRTQLNLLEQASLDLWIQFLKRCIWEKLWW